MNEVSRNIPATTNNTIARVPSTAPVKKSIATIAAIDILIAASAFDIFLIMMNP
jgi:hypothetical protein